MTNGDSTPAARAYLWTFGAAEFDEARWELRIGGQPVELERKPLEVLQYLLRHAGEAVTKEELLASVWAGRVVVEAVLPNTIGKLRKALNDEDQVVITTLARVGYRLSVPVAHKPVEFLPDASRLSVGDAVPRRPNWKLDTPLARTEGNEVWLARHAKTNETRVFKFSLAGKGLTGLKREVTIARLLREALGEREDFVHVLDWDFEDAPYFVEAEYGGLSLDRWPEGQTITALPLEQRLALFVEAADAVAAAHSVGVLHKDIKPANLLVYEASGAHHLRVADFGSSRLFDTGSIDALGITRLGLTQTQALTTDATGTPLYLAPELAAGQSPTIKSDIYALGVTLYQLVVGDFRRPLSPGWEREVGDELLRQDIADAANGDPGKRPASASELAERIRSLDARRETLALEQAVRARVEEGERKLAKARARRPWAIAAGVLLVAGSAGSLFYASQARKAEQRAEASLRAQTKLNAFLSEDVIGAAAPDRNDGKQPTVLEALDKAEAGVAKRFDTDPGSAGTMRLALAHAYKAVAQVEKAQTQYAQALPLLQKAFGQGDERSYDAALGSTHMLIELGKFDEASNGLKAVAAQLATQPDAPAQTLYRHLHTRAYLHERRSDWKSAAADYQALVELTERRTELGEDLLFKSQAELGNALLAIGQADPAVAMIRKSLDGLEKLKGPDDSATVQARQNLVQALMQVGKMSDALEQTRLLEASLIKLLGPETPQMANVNTIRAIALVAQDKFAEAATEYGKANQLFSRTLGPDSPFTLSTLQYRGEALRWAGRSIDTVSELGARLTDAQRVFGDPSPALAEYAMILAMAHVDVGDSHSARALGSLIHADDGKIAPDVNSQRIPYLRLLQGLLLEAEGQSKSALAKYEEALAALPADSDYSKEIKRRISALKDPAVARQGSKKG